MTKATLFYLLSEQGRKNSILKGGDGKEFQTLETEATPEILELGKVEQDGKVLLPVGCKVDRYGKLSLYTDCPVINYQIAVFFGEPRINPVQKNTYFDTVQTPAQLVAHEQARITYITAKKAEIGKEYQPLLATYKEKEATKAAEKAKADEERKAKEERERIAREAEKATRETERREWITAHGSQYLKDCLDLDVKASLEYVVERAEFEFPGYTVDYADNARWDEKFSPSPEALAELKKLRAKNAESKIVWLTSPAKVRDNDESDEYDDELEPCEAVAIRKFLGKFDLVKII